MYGYEILHEDILDRLIKNVRAGVTQHAYIFEGERGGGSLAAAQLFANALVCIKKELAPCGACISCTLAKAGNHPDIHIVAPPKDKKNILVDQIRDILTDSMKKPYEDGKKVYIVTYGDEMNEQAQNAFLKLLEEPPLYAVFIILAENTEALLPTVRSRCEIIKFLPVPEEKIKEILKTGYPDIKNADFLARYSMGNIEKAKKLASDEGFMPLRSGAFDMLKRLLSENVSESYDVAEFAELNKADAETILGLWLDFLRDMMLIQNDGGKYAVNSDYYDKLHGLALRLDEKKIVTAISEVINAQEMLKRYVNLHTLILSMAFRIKKDI